MTSRLQNPALVRLPVAGRRWPSTARFLRTLLLLAVLLLPAVASAARAESGGADRFGVATVLPPPAADDGASLSLPAALAIPQAPAVTAPARLPPPGFSVVDLKFGLYAMGGQAFDVDFTVTRTGAGLHMTQAMRSTGAANLMMRMRMAASMQARIGSDGLLQPLRYLNQSDGTFSRRSVLMEWDAQGMPRAVVSPPTEEDDRDPVPEAMIRGTLDPTTAALTRLMRASAEPPCEGSEKVFDGRRRYDLQFTPVQMESIPPSSRSAYAGLAFRCQMRTLPIAGYNRKYLEGTKRFEQEPTDIWLVHQPAAGIWLPVRLRSSWTFGDVTGHIAAASVDGAVALGPVEGVTWPRPVAAAQ